MSSNFCFSWELQYYVEQPLELAICGRELWNLFLKGIGAPDGHGGDVVRELSWNLHFCSVPCHPNHLVMFKSRDKKSLSNATPHCNLFPSSFFVWSSNFGQI